MKYVLMLLLLTTAFTMGQTSTIQHAPTVDQCRADLRLWWAEDRTTIESLTAGTLDQRRYEMHDCSSVLAGTEAHDSEFLKQVYDGHLVNRMEDFLTRHGLLGQFAEEDTKGKR